MNDDDGGSIIDCYWKPSLLRGFGVAVCRLIKKLHCIYLLYCVVLVDIGRP